MTPNRTMIDAFVDGRLSADDHELMVHHISSCTECAAAVIAALAEAARALAAESSDRAAAGSSNGAHPSVADVASAEQQPVTDRLQLDFTLDHSRDQPELLLRHDTVQEIQLDDLPPGTSSSAGRQPVVADSLAVVSEVVEAVASVETPVTTPPVSELADSVVKAGSEEAAEMAGIAATDDVEITELVPDRIDVPDSAEPAAMDEGAPEISGEITAAAEGEPGLETLVVIATEPELAAAAGHAPAPDAAPDSEALDLSDTVAAATAVDVAESAAHGAVALAESASAEAATEPETPAGLEPTVEPAAAAPEELPPPVDERVPDETRAAIVSAVRGDAEVIQPRRRWSGVLSAAAAFLIFAVAAAYAAVQLRAFADPDRAPVVATPPPPQEAEFASILVPILDSAVFAQVVDIPDSVLVVGDSGAVSSVLDSGVTTGRAPVADTAADSAARRARQRAAARRAREQRRAAAAAAIVAASQPRLLRTTTHQYGDVDLVLREYDASAPAPGSRPGVNEYRWADESLTRLFVLTGPVQVGRLRAFARSLQSSRTP